MTGVPAHVPRSAVSVSPSTRSPEIDGAAVLDGGAGATTALGGEVAVSVPPAFVPLTTTTIVWPTSAGVRS